MKTAAILIILVLLAGPLTAQEVESEYKIPKRVDLAIAETMGINFLVWAGNRYVREDNYSFFISWRSIEANLRHGMEWDPNKFKGNFFDHPYHGNTYFNAARTNGLSFWESTPFAFGGSLMWEIAMESEYPAYNDLLTTTLGGIALGETFFRFSEQVLDDRASGGERFWREFAGFLLNPVGGFNRLIRGDMGRRSSSVDHIRMPIQGALALGTRARVSGGDSGVEDFAPAFELTMHYGEPFKMKDSRLPFDYFTFRYWSSSADTTRNVSILARATLVGKNFAGDGGQRHLLSLFQHYDYVNNELFKVGAISVGSGLMSRFELGGDFQLTTGPFLGYIIIGAGSNEYVESYQGRDYNYGRGVKGKFDVMLAHPSYGNLYVDYNYFSIYSREGAPGIDRLHIFDATYIVPVFHSFGLGAEYQYYHRDAHYDEFPDVEKTIKGPRLLATYSF
jgi:hypothetical protein